MGVKNRAGFWNSASKSRTAASLSSMRVALVKAASTAFEGRISKSGSIFLSAIVMSLFKDIESNSQTTSPSFSWIIIFDDVLIYGDAPSLHFLMMFSSFGFWLSYDHELFHMSGW